MPGGAIQTASVAPAKIRGPLAGDCADTSDGIAARRSVVAAISSLIEVGVIRATCAYRPARASVTGLPRGHTASRYCPVLSLIGILIVVAGFAARFNPLLVVLPDEYAVIKAQIPTALLLLTVSTLIMYTFVFRRS